VKLVGKFIEGNFRVQSDVIYLQWEAESSCSTIFVSAGWIWILVGVVIYLVKTTIWSDGCSKLSSVAHMVNFYFSDGCCCWPECLRSKLRERGYLNFFSLKWKCICILSEWKYIWVLSIFAWICSYPFAWDVKECVEIALWISVCQRENNYLQLLIVNSLIYSTWFENNRKWLHASLHMVHMILTTCSN
jgi:hypothetical protein